MSVRAWMGRRPGMPRHPASALRNLPARADAWEHLDLVLHPASGWVFPYWLERQLDPESPAFTPRGEVQVLANTTHRNWTKVGGLDSTGIAVVDPRGLVTPWAGGWSLDWWIGADDRWHLPSREVGVRQSALGAAPVVETAMRIPGGDAVHRVFAIQRSSQEGGGDVVVVEVENLSKTPVALALAVRPFNVEGLASVDRIDLIDGTTLTVDGQVAMVLPKAPSRVSASTLVGGDSAAEVTRGDAATDWPGEVLCPSGMGQAAVVYPLAHGTTFRVALPLVPAPVAAGRPFPGVVPAASDVARGWAAQAGRGARFVLPDDRLSEAVDANRRHLLVAGGDVAGADPLDDPPLPFRDAALLLSGLDLYGYHDEAARVLASYMDRQRLDGAFGAREETSASGAALWAAGHHWRLTRDRTLAEALVGPIAKGAHWVGRRRGRKARPVGRLYAEDLWGIAGLRAAAELLAGVDQPEASEDAGEFATGIWEAVEQSLSQDAERLGTVALPAGHGRDLDPAMIDPLVVGALLDVPELGADRLAATLDVVRERFLGANGKAFYQGIASAGLSPYLTLQLGEVELRAGDSACLERLAWALEAATPTWTWPAAVHPRVGGGSAGSGHHELAAVGLLRFVRNLLVRESRHGLELASVVPDMWLGQGWEVHDAPTAWGTFSYAVRWHGERPALLWDLSPQRKDEDETGSGTGTVKLTAPGLDPNWSSTEPRGEALLSPVSPPEAQHGSFG